MWTEFCLAERNSAHVLVSARISWLLDTCLSVIHNANYIVNSIVCAVILVRGSRVPSYGIRPMHGKIHVVNMHGTGTKHIVRHSQKSVVQWSVISKFTCMYFVPHFGHAKVYETSIWTPCFQISAKTLPRRTSSTKDLLVLQKFYWSYKFFFNIKRKNIA